VPVFLRQCIQCIYLIFLVFCFHDIMLTVKVALLLLMDAVHKHLVLSNINEVSKLSAYSPLDRFVGFYA